MVGKGLHPFFGQLAPRFRAEFGDPDNLDVRIPGRHRNVVPAHDAGADKCNPDGIGHSWNSPDLSKGGSARSLRTEENATDTAQAFSNGGFRMLYMASTALMYPAAPNPKITPVATGRTWESCRKARSAYR